MSPYQELTEGEESGESGCAPHRLKVLAVFIGSAVALLLVAHGAGDWRLRGSVPATSLAATEDQCVGISAFSTCFTGLDILAILGAGGSLCAALCAYVTWVQKQDAKNTLKILRDLIRQLNNNPEDTTLRQQAINKVRETENSPLKDVYEANEPDMNCVLNNCRALVQSSPKFGMVMDAMKIAVSSRAEYSLQQTKAERCKMFENKQKRLGLYTDSRGDETVEYNKIPETEVKTHLENAILSKKSEWGDRYAEIKAKADSAIATMSGTDVYKKEMRTFHVDNGRLGGSEKFMMYMIIASAKSGNKREVLMAYGWRKYILKSGMDWVMSEETNTMDTCLQWMQFCVFEKLKKWVPTVPLYSSDPSDPSTHSNQW